MTSSTKPEVHNIYRNAVREGPSDQYKKLSRVVFETHSSRYFAPLS